MKKSIFAITVLLMASATISAQKYLGGDISLLPKYEETGTVYRDIKGKTVKSMDFFKTQGWNAMRVRLFVQPGNANQENKDEGVCQDLPFVIKLSKRIKKAGYKLMLDFHYSDTWADPAKQFTPKSWLNTNTRTLNDTIYNYTTRCLRAMKAEGVTPDMIQVGNEISFGMLWPTGKIDPQTPNNWDIFTDYLKSGIRACRKECPDAKIIIHTERAGEWELTKSFYLHLKQYNVDYDIIGLSYYPMWHKTIPILSNTLDSIESMFPEKKVMIVETAFYYSHDKDIWAKSKNEYSEFYPINAEGQRTFTSQLVKELNRHNNVTGLFWWFPEENGYKNNVIKSWINRGLFNNKNGKALPALYETKNFIK